ncbi:hypothetical protein [Sedimenticola hydrogenitrophicus]|uniref:hypothetical protein n=1 Tax=Sedimenticola hydrogenitrophicus TaxID=2967975 RepID=UPI0023B1CA86|nr:hypothetical protein [Sedimenticola hydrogenitrophicus]
METAVAEQIENGRYAQCIAASKKVYWDIDKDVIRGREFDFSKRFLPDTLSKVDELEFLGEDEKRFMTQVQGRTYANTFGLVERFISAKVLEVSRDHWLGDQTALEALVRFSNEELKHQELFRRIERMVGQGMPAGYSYRPQPNDVAGAVLSKSTWSVLALTCHIEIFVQAHYRENIDPVHQVDGLFKDVFRYHWMEEAQHATLDELEWQREDDKLSAAERDQAVTGLIALVGAVDGILQMQSKADTEYFVAVSGRMFSTDQRQRIEDTVLKAYRWQYIVSGVQHPRFAARLGSLISEAQMQRIGEALAGIMG